MRTFCSEFQTRYETYSFGYCLYAELERLDELAAVYDAGYLPYSGDPGEPRLLFYRARSLRVRLADLAMDKKRRYLQEDRRVMLWCLGTQLVGIIIVGVITTIGTMIVYFQDRLPRFPLPF